MSDWLDILYKAFWCGWAATGFAVLFNAPVRALWAVYLLGFTAGLVKYTIMLPSVEGGIIFASLLAASCVGMLSIPLAHGRHVPPIVLSIPAVIPLVPGSFAYRSMLGLIRFINRPEVDVISGAVHNGLMMVFIILALTIGVTLPMLLFRIESVKHLRLTNLKRSDA